MNTNPDTCLAFELNHYIETESGDQLMVSDIEAFHDEVIALIEKRGWHTSGGLGLIRRCSACGMRHAPHKNECCKL